MRKKKNNAAFKFTPFSKKQKKVLTWWMPGTPVCDADAIIADGAVRSGKTIIMSLSFVLWAMSTYCYENFGMAGKTIGSFRRNVLFLLKIILRLRGYKVEDKRTDNLIIVRKNGRENYFYIFGGKDERSQDLVQGFTSAGFFFDEVTLMPESFVNQAVARCSVEGAKLWFNCNPESPYHWFKLSWIDNLEAKNAIRISFTLDDNPSLSERVKNRYKRMFTGVFYKRYILGLWVMAEGIIYDMFSPEKNVVKTKPRKYVEYHISIDYGTLNPTAFGLWGLNIVDQVWYKIKEYHYDGRKSAKQKTDEEYYKDLEEFAGDLPITFVIVDPSAASFITLIRKRNIFMVKKAKNDVLDGIRNVSTCLVCGFIKYNDCCTETFREYHSYVWDDKAQESRGEDKPIKQNDHHLDADRYFVNTIIAKKGRVPLNVAV